MTLQEMLDMELNTKDTSNPIADVVRVPGGWIYAFYGNEEQSGTFVPEPPTEII